MWMWNNDTTEMEWNGMKNNLRYKIFDTVKSGTCSIISFKYDGGEKTSEFRLYLDTFVPFPWLNQSKRA